MKQATYKKPDQFTAPESKINLALFVSATVEGEGKNSRFIPYKPNDTDDSYWTVDSGNDWKIKFIDDHAVEVIHRYQDKDAIAALAKWIAYRTGGKIVDETPDEFIYLRDERKVLNAMLGVNWNSVKKGTECRAANVISDLASNYTASFSCIKGSHISGLDYAFHVAKRDGLDASFKYCIPVSVFNELDLPCNNSNRDTED